jgi:peroxiredoxin
MIRLLLSLLLMIPVLLFAQSKEELVAQIKDKPTEIATLRLIQRVGGYDPDHKELRMLFKGLDKKVKKSNDGKIFERYLDALENSSVGKKAPGITQLDLEGEPYSLQDLKGKYVLVDFWASWCPPCREENPNLVATYAEFKDKNFEILGVSLDREFGPWKKAIEDDKLTWKHISDLQYWNSGAAQTYGIKAIPQNVLVNPEGIIIAKNIHGEALKNKLREVLK